MIKREKINFKKSCQIKLPPPFPYRYVQQKRVKALENESKLKQVYVPAYTNKSTRLTGANGEILIRGRDCDAYPKLAKYSWTQYKKYVRI